MAKVQKATEAQQAAIELKDKTLLISAAAGSGKTWTLTERIIHRLTKSDPKADISKMLIVTFTRASTADLRYKIFKAISSAVAQNPSDRHLSTQLMKVSSAKICTIDSFCLDIIHSNMPALGLSGTRRIADTTEYLILARETMGKVIEQMYEDEPAFPRFAECFSDARHTDSLIDTFLDFHSKLLTVPKGVHILGDWAERTKNEIGRDFFDTHYGTELMKSSDLLFSHYKSFLEEVNEYLESDPDFIDGYGHGFSHDLRFCTALCEAAKDKKAGYATIHRLLANYSPVELDKIKNKKANETTALYRDIRSKHFYKAIKALKAKAFARDPSVISVAMEQTAIHLSILYELLLRFDNAISAEKDKLGIINFSDIRRFTMQLLVDKDGQPTSIAKQYADQYTDIFIDEYQDVDEVQDLIFSSISKPNNRFLVGDIKQSIYSFRGAEPSLFASYRKNDRDFPLYDSPRSESSNGVSIFMSENFRCDENIVNFTNTVCAPLFKESDSIDYKVQDNLCFKKDCSGNSADYVSPKVKVAIVKAPSPKEKANSPEFTGHSAFDYEAEYIASEIERLIKSKTPKADGTPIKPGDIAILFRSSTICPALISALDRHGILSTDTDSSKYFESPDVLIVLSLLNVIDNPERDIFLAGTLRSSLFDFELEELIKIKTVSDKAMSLYGALCKYADDFNDGIATKCKGFIDTLARWQAEASSMSVDKFLRRLFNSDIFLATGLVAQPSPSGEGGNLLLLYDYARRFENGTFKGLYRFIEYINSMIERKQTIETNDNSNDPEKVTLLTIHKSKGLEFPVCFIAHSDYDLKPKESNDSLVFHKLCGPAMKLSDPTGLALINTPMREAVLSTIATYQKHEEMRILYVALTRARERLYVTSSTISDPSAFLYNMEQRLYIRDKYTVISACKTYLDWILLSCSTDVNPSYEIDFIPLKAIEEKKPTDSSKDEEAVEAFVADEALTQQLREGFNFKYRYDKLYGVPTKLSVSRLYPDVLDHNSDSLELFTEPKAAYVPPFFSGTGDTANAADRGVATHLFLQFCNIELARSKGAEEELNRLISKGFLPVGTESLIYIDELQAFLKSELADKICNAEKVIREQRFNIKLSPASFTKNKELIEQMEGEQLAVQGVIDLIVVNHDGSIELYDYKTDRLSKAELENTSLAEATMQKRHGSQLSYYAKAVELLFGKPCKRVAVFSTHSSKLYDIDTSSIDSINVL